MIEPLAWELSGSQGGIVSTGGWQVALPYDKGGWQ